MLLLDKPEGLSSNQVLQQVKRLLNARKAGHTGSLDPMATGLLPICFGQATKISGLFLSADKTYHVGIRLGITTDTGDRDGKVIEESPVEVSESRLADVLNAYRGEFLQIPPMYSALKKDGQPLYKLARQGITIERQPRPATVYSLEQEGFDGSKLTLTIRCSKGFYIRALAEDIGRDIGCGGHVECLRRIGVGEVTVDQAVTMAQLKNIFTPGGREALMLPIDQGLAHLPAIWLSDILAHYLRKGRSIRVHSTNEVGMVRLYVESGDFLGIGEVMPNQRVQPMRLF